jgi:hypothetical protein
VLIREPGRALHAADVERAVGVPVVAELDLDPAVARAVDAGLLAARLPRSLQRRLAPSPDQSPSTASAAPQPVSDAGTTAAGQVRSIASIQPADSGPRPVTVEVHVADGPSGYQIVGAGDQLCRASRDRIRAAFVNSGLAWPDQQITVNVMPAGRGPPDAAIDVAIAAGILGATGRLDRTMASNHAYVGELALDGGIIATSDLDRSTVERVTGLPAAHVGHLRDLASVINPAITHAAPVEPSPAGPILATWHQTPAAGVDPSSGLDGIG